MPEYRLSITKAITNDYVLFNCLVFPVISLVVTIMTAGNPLLIGILAIVSITALMIAAIRFIRIMKMINENQIVDDIVASIELNTKRGTIYIDYVYREGKYRSCQYVIRTRSSTFYKQGDRVRVLVDWNDPRKALIAGLYTTPRQTT